MSWLRASIQGGFWSHLQQLVREKTIPFQWMALNDEIPGAPPSHSMENFRVAAGRSRGEYHGMVFQDSDLYKWLEAAGHALHDESPGNGSIRERVEEAVDLIAAAQQPDGYLNTYFIVKEPGRKWKNLREAHELYCAGHLMEAAVAVHRSTGNRKILSVARRLADAIDSRFGTGEGKVRGYCGHEEVELALVKLYRLTGEKRYLSLAKYFIDERGKQPRYFDEEAKEADYVPIFGIHEPEYYQAKVPVRQLAAVSGHAVRAMYLCTAMADVARETADEELGRVCDGLWDNAANRRMYVTGGIGSSARNEAFGADFDLPNDTAYAETCAAIGLFVFSSRMAGLRHDGRFADVMERSLYNGILGGLGLDGQSYFYVNPLSVRPESCDENPSRQFVKYRRQSWYGCACCPPNVARLVASLGDYAYHLGDGALYVDLFHDGSVSFAVESRQIAFRQRTDYPWSGEISFEFIAAGPAELDLAVRIPAWCRSPSLSLNRARPQGANPVQGYAHVRREWRHGDVLKLSLPMPVERVRSDPRVDADHGKVAIQRGPVVYCLEQADNGPFLHTVVLPPDARLESLPRADLLGGIVTVKGRGRAWDGSPPFAGLYGSAGSPGMKAKDLVFVPYYAWANREPGEMTVWVRE